MVTSIQFGRYSPKPGMDLYQMVTLNTVRTCVGKQFIAKNRFKFATAVDFDKYIEEIKLPILLHAYY